MISFFTHSGGAGLIRGEQVAKRIGAKLNPKEGYENDVCIYVKCVPPDNYPKNSYIDVVEDSAGLRWVKQHPTVGIIASSKSIYEHLKGILKNKIVLIPQHHCNFERIKRTRKEIKIVGIIGNKAAFQYPLDKLKFSLDRMGLELKTLIKKVFTSRQEVVDFYKEIDMQLVWRPNSDGILRNPLKLINAMSFGIPTIAYPEKDFLMELENYFIGVKYMDEMIEESYFLSTGKYYYDEFVKKGVLKSEEYHIDNISKLYLKLC